MNKLHHRTLSCLLRLSPFLPFSSFASLASIKRPASDIAMGVLITSLGTFAATTAFIATPSMAQLEPSSAPEDTSDPFIPVARVNPEQPISVVIVNDTRIPLEYSFSTNNIAPQELAMGEVATLNSAPIPTSLFINAFTSTAILDYAIEAIAEDNTLIVTVSLVNQLYDAAGFNAIDIHETGAIYRY